MIEPVRESSAVQPPLRLEVALVPSLLPPDAPDAPDAPDVPGAPRGETVFIVVDVIRATTSLCVLFEQGAREVLVAPGVAAARALGPQLGQDTVLAGEAGGARPDGFDYGNSPAELSRALVADRAVLFATTNGTRAIRACAGGHAILAGALRNAQAVARSALAAVPVPAADERAIGDNHDEAEVHEIVIVCSGREDLPAYDDTICAGYIVRRLVEAAVAQGRQVELESGARIALAALRGAEAEGGIRAALAQSGAYQHIASIGLAGDLDWCAATDVTNVVPRVTGTLSGHDLIVMRASEDERQRAGG